MEPPLSKPSDCNVHRTPLNALVPPGSYVYAESHTAPLGSHPGLASFSRRKFTSTRMFLAATRSKLAEQQSETYRRVQRWCSLANHAELGWAATTFNSPRTKFISNNSASSDGICSGKFGLNDNYQIVCVYPIIRLIQTHSQQISCISRWVVLIAVLRWSLLIIAMASWRSSADDTWLFIR